LLPASQVFHLYAISLGGVANTVPFITLSPVVSVLIGMPLNGEYPASLGIFGVLMICTGAAALALSKQSPAAAAGSDDAEGKTADGGSPVLGATVEEAEEKKKKAGDEVKGILCMLVVALLWAFSASCQKMALKVVPFAQLTACTNCLMTPFFGWFSYRLIMQQCKAETAIAKYSEHGEAVELSGLLEGSAAGKEKGAEKETKDGVIMSGTREGHAGQGGRKLARETNPKGEVPAEGEDAWELVEELAGPGRQLNKSLTSLFCPLLAVVEMMHGSAMWYIGTGLVEFITLTFYFVAMKHLYVSYLLALKRGGSVVLSVAGGAIFFAEPVGQREKLCIGVMAVGVCLVVMS